MNICPNCGKSFEPKTKLQKYCDPFCQLEHSRNVTARKAKEKRRAERKTEIMCSVFNCDRVHKSLCCGSCSQRGICKNRCRNSPDKCGLVRGKAKKPKSRSC